MIQDIQKVQTRASEENEFPFISISHNDPKKLFCKICICEFYSHGRPHKNSSKHEKNVFISELKSDSALKADFSFISLSLEDEVNEAFCKICECNLSINLKHFRAHKNSQKHKDKNSKKENVQGSVQFPFISISEDDPEKLYCNICKTKLSHDFRILIHVKTKKHKENVTAHKVNVVNSYLELDFPFISKSLNDPTKLACKICKCDLNTNTKFIQEHENSLKHKKNVNPRLKTKICRKFKVEFL